MLKKAFQSYSNKLEERCLLLGKSDAKPLCVCSGLFVTYPVHGNSSMFSRASMFTRLRCF